MSAQIAYEQEDEVAIERMMDITAEGVWPRHWPWYLLRAVQAQQRQIERLESQLEEPGMTK